jgi:hypothetical protein
MEIEWCLELNQWLVFRHCLFRKSYPHVKLMQIAKDRRLIGPAMVMNETASAKSVGCDQQF